MIEIITQNIKNSAALKLRLLENPDFISKIELAANNLVQAFQQGNKVLFCGNGGSAADAQHLAAELSGRFYLDRPPLYAEALHVNASYMTAVANDYGYDMVYARMIAAAGEKGDILVAISTSGNSENIIKAAECAQQQGMKIIALTGNTGGKLRSVADILLNVPSDDTPRIQEVHILLGHILCELIEKSIFNG